MLALSTQRSSAAALLVAACAAWLTLAPDANARADDAVVVAPVATDVPVERRVSAHLNFLASDELGGRETGTLEGEIAAHYVASVFRSIGLEPAGADGGYLAPYELETSQLDIERTALTFHVGSDDVGGLEDVRLATGLALFDDFVVRGYTGDGFSIDAPVTFAGHGVVDEATGVDEYDGLDVEGHFVLVFSGAPGNRADLRSAGQWRNKRAAAKARGAAGLAIVVDGEDDASQRLFGYLGSSARRKSMGLKGPEPEPGFPLVYITTKGAETLATLADRKLSTMRVKPIGEPWPNCSIVLTAPVDAQTIVAHNVAGLIRGTDPALADEVIVMSAHMDHIGRNDDGTVNNGADDNASGTTTLLTAAEILAAAPPKRSVLMLAVSGEEKGLLGSRAWVANPTLPLERVVANINTDMVGRNDPNLIGATPSPEHEGFNTLVTKAAELAPASGLELRWAVGKDRYQRKVDVYYHRSDHANFADAGIPVIFFFAGEHADYHRASDTIEKIDLAKIGKMARFVSHLAFEVGNDPERPELIESDS